MIECHCLVSIILNYFSYEYNTYIYNMTYILFFVYILAISKPLLFINCIRCRNDYEINIELNVSQLNDLLTYKLR